MPCGFAGEAPGEVANIAIKSHCRIEPVKSVIVKSKISVIMYLVVTCCLSGSGLIKSVPR